MAFGQQPVIINRKKRKKKPASHGGAWKVAFADFTLAMMAFFMVLWIIQVADIDERAKIVQYLKGDLFSDGPINPFELSKAKSLIDFEGAQSLQFEIMPDAGNQQNDRHSLAVGTFKNKAILPGQHKNNAQLELLAKEVEQIIADTQMGNHVKMTIVPQGIRILIHDNIDQFMFTRGSANIQHYFEDLLLTLGQLLGRIDNGIIISGHTDSLPFAGNTFTNWELSSQRALVARRVLQAGGVDYQQVLQVVGMADQTPYITTDATAAANRRVELLILTHAAKNDLLNIMTGQQSEPAPPSQSNNKNQPSEANKQSQNSSLQSLVEQAQSSADANMPRVRYPHD